MGEIIPLFIKRKSLPQSNNFSVEQIIKLQALQKSLEILLEEEKKIEEIISQKCKEEFGKLQRIEYEKKQLELEIERIHNKIGINHKKDLKKNDNSKSK